MNDKIVLNGKMMRAVYDKQCGGFISLTSPYDDYKADFLLTPEEFPEYDIDECEWLGNIDGKILVGGRQYAFYSGWNKDTALVDGKENQLQVTYPAIKSGDIDLGFSLQLNFVMVDNELRWTVRLHNYSDAELKFTDINIPLLMNQYFRIDDDFKYDRCVLRHTCITGHSSYMYWEKSSGNGPVLLLAPLGAGTFTNLRQEFENRAFGPQHKLGAYEGMVRACVVCEQPVIPYDTVEPWSVASQETRELQFVLAMLEKEEQINDTLNSFSLTNLKAIPGVVGPIDEDFLILTRPVGAEVSLFEKEDRIIGSEVKNGWRVTRVRFGGYGRRYVKVQNDGQIAAYCFFVTEPVAEIIDQHADFIARNHLETNPEDPCYHGMLIWDMVNKRRINHTFNPYFEPWWSGGSDDPGLVSGLFLSEKNVYRPKEEEINALNAYVEDFLLVRLTEQPGWRVHRMVPWYTMFEPWAGRGADDVWRAFNYVHVINTVWNMYRIQKQRRWSRLREANEYLKMAYEYTKAMFNYWMFPDGVGASEFGNMGEMTLPLYLAEDLKKEGFIQEASEMTAIFDKKSHFFNSKQFPFGSEMPYDSTAFEAVYAYGKRIKSDHIMRSSAKASYSNRGKQPVWYLYCTDVRGGGDTSWNTSYMTQLGAYPILDYALHQGHVEEDWIMAYYGAYLSGWLIYNSGGYWDADEANKGATGWITISSQINVTGTPHNPRGKKGMPLSKGCVILSGEAGLGFFGALRTACSIVIEHSVLGRIGLGCSIDCIDGKEIVTPRDGLSARFYHIPGRWHAEVEGGAINALTITEDSILIDTTAVSKEKLMVRVSGIPNEGEEERLIFERTVYTETDPLKFEVSLR